MEKKNLTLHNVDDFKGKIYTIRGVQVMLDSDLAEIYGYEVKKLNQQVKRNINRFPPDFMFQLTREEFNLVKSQYENIDLKSQFVTSSWGGIRKLPNAFTEQGIYMLATVLRGDLADQQSIFIMRAFREMRNFLQNNASLFAEIDTIQKHLIESDIHHKEHDKQIAELFSLMDKYKVKDTQGIFFQGQIFDAYAKFQSFIAQAQKEIVLIDNYVDITVLERLSTKNNGVDVIIYTLPNTRLTAQDIRSFNAQYPTLTVRHTTSMHDRFLIIDNSTLYHLGASLKDLGRKCFAFELFDAGFIPDILAKVI
ncbi:MAG: ORF6N domain-containing protein [Paludibacteraceae bacterium]|nr:ORF6N domain-containing protein [Paludibacteraceae bacterium]